MAKKVIDNYSGDNWEGKLEDGILNLHCRTEYKKGETMPKDVWDELYDIVEQVTRTGKICIYKNTSVSDEDKCHITARVLSETPINEL